MNKLVNKYSPTLLQNTIGSPLRSEQRSGELLPRVLSSTDMLTIFIVVVLFIPNASVVLATPDAGIATYVYWVVVTVTFLLPGALVSGQLNRFMPADGALYVWTHRAMGPLWGFFAAFCAWIPGILVLLAATDYILTLIQGIQFELTGGSSDWLTAPWEQGTLVLIVLAFAAILSTLPTTFIMRLSKCIVVLYGLGILLIGLAGVLWLYRGNAPQTSLTTGHLSFRGQNIVLYGVIVLALLGVEIPFNMAAETKRANASTLFLRWGPLLVLIAYLLGTFGVMTVVPPMKANALNSTITAVSMVFGSPLAIVVGCVFVSFFLIVTVIYNISFARMLVVSALDHRLPQSLAKINRHAAPYFATHTQIIIVACIAIFTYFIGPELYPWAGPTFSYKIYNISQATTTIIWCISMIFLFLDLPILLYRFRALLAKTRDQLTAPPWLLYLCCIVGCLASLLGIWTTISTSWDNRLIPTNEWVVIVSWCVIISLFIGFIGAAYPRLLSNLKLQTAIAEDNARLYYQLQNAYTKLSELDQLKDAFLTTASHELRTPLTIVQGYLDLLGELDDDINPEARRKFLSNARRACDELVLLQANIMDASRIKFDTSTILCTTIHLKEICNSVIDLFEPMILQEHRKLVVNIDDTITVWADETRLKQILRNLISNALRYSAPRTPIQIDAAVDMENDLARISVKDLGLGIPLHKQETIFDKFVRLERDMHGTTRGSGLGLFITRQLVEAMRGTISIESSGTPGDGSTFTFTLPLKETVLRLSQQL